MTSTTTHTLLFTAIGLLVSLTLPAQSALEPGRLRLELPSRGLFVRIDSVVYDLNAQSEDLELMLSPGIHVVELRASGRRQERLEVTIEPGHTTLITGDLSEGGHPSVRTLNHLQLKRRSRLNGYLGLSGFLLLDAVAIGQWTVLDRNEEKTVADINALYTRYSRSVSDIGEVGAEYERAVRAYNRQHIRYLLFRGATVALVGGTVYAIVRQLRRNRRSEPRIGLRFDPPFPGLPPGGLHLTYTF